MRICDKCKDKTKEALTYYVDFKRANCGRYNMSLELCKECHDFVQENLLSLLTQQEIKDVAEKNGK